ncbi:MAG: hypothetical protein ACI4JJ_06830 [Huintestinicola sp.]
MATPKKSNFGQAALMCLSDKTVVVVLIALAAAAAAFFLSEDITLPYLIDCAGAALIILAVSFGMHFHFAKCGINRSMAKELIKGFDPRICGSLEDMGGVGSLLSAAAGVSVLLSELYISERGIFAIGAYSDSDGRYAFPAVYAIAFAVMTAVSVYMLTSKQRMNCMIYAAAADEAASLPADEPEDKRLRSAMFRFSSDESRMARIQKGMTLRMTVSLSLDLVLIGAALTGMVSPFSLMGIAGLACTADMISTFCMRTHSQKKSAPSDEDKKIPLWTASGKGTAAAFTVVFVLISAAFLYTFPFRSVYTVYMEQEDYYYTDSFMDAEPLLLTPSRVPLYDVMFTAYHVISVFFVLAASAAICSESADMLDVYVKEKRLSAVTGIVILLTGISVAAAGFFRDSCVLSTTQWLVTASVCALIMMIAIFRGFVVFSEKKSDKSAKMNV